MFVLSIFLLICAALTGCIAVWGFRNAYVSEDAATRVIGYVCAFPMAMCAAVTAVVGVVLW